MVLYSPFVFVGAMSAATPLSPANKKGIVLGACELPRIFWRQGAARGIDGAGIARADLPAPEITGTGIVSARLLGTVVTSSGVPVRGWRAQ